MIEQDKRTSDQLRDALWEASWRLGREYGRTTYGLTVPFEKRDRTETRYVTGQDTDDAIRMFLAELDEETLRNLEWFPYLEMRKSYGVTITFRHRLTEERRVVDGWDRADACRNFLAQLEAEKAES